MKYSSPKHVMLKLLQGGKRKSMMELRNRYKKKNPEYSELIAEGILMYDHYVVNEELNKFTKGD